MTTTTTTNASLISQIEGLLDKKLTPLQQSVDGLVADMNNLKADFKAMKEQSVTKEELKAELLKVPAMIKHEVSEQIKAVGHSGSSSSAELDALRKMVDVQQRTLDKWDPASKQLAVKAWSDETPDERIRTMTDFAKTNFHDLGTVTIKNTFKGPYGKRTMSPASLMEFGTIEQRDAALKKIEAGAEMMSKGAPLTVTFAKHTRQLQRNGILRKALELVQKHPKTQGKTVTIDWGKPKTDRAVLVKDSADAVETRAFVQGPSDMIGSFSKEFQNLKIE